VNDTGLGISEVDQESIYDEFSQLNNPERNRRKGLGLGLSIVKRSANLLGDAIELESTLGEGSVFSITVDRAEETDLEAPQRSTEAVIAPPVYESTILIIDDDSSILQGMQSLLALWGCNVITAIDLKTAVSVLERQEIIPDGIISDYRLPNNTTGLQAIEHLHAMFGVNIPTLILTGDTSVDRIQEVNSSGFQVLYKPVSPIKLRAFLQRLKPTHSETDLSS
jgi:CheY-like chemotaxis protein